VDRAKPEIIEPLFTARELAGMLRLDVRTIRAAAAQGELLAVRVGYQRRFPQTAVRAWLELQAAEPEPGTQARGPVADRL
jgi:excisionase family DNA binding protein